MSHFKILPECYADTLLVEILGFKSPNHQLGIGAVLRTLGKNFKNTNAVGIVDDDKQKPTDFAAFALKEEQENVQRRQKEATKHTVLVIRPAFEDWVFQNARAVNVAPNDYGFRNAKAFRNICKQENARDNRKLRDFLNTLKQKKAPGFVQLKRWICEELGLDEADF